MIGRLLKMFGERVVPWRWVQVIDGSDPHLIIMELNGEDFGRLSRNHDSRHVQIVPDDQVPDMVWAEIAKHALTKGTK